MTTTEPESPCDLRCGYVSSDRDLIDHMLYEHKRCPDCGSAPIAVYDSVTHEPWCPRLQPGYVYPATGSGYAPYDGPLEGDDDPYANDVIGDQT